MILLLTAFAIKGADVVDVAHLNNKLLIPDSHVEVPHIQMNVANQRWGAKCGLNALFNGITIAQLAQSNSVQKVDILKKLKDFDEREKLFGTDQCSWGRLVSIKRTQELIMSDIQEQIGLCIKGSACIDTISSEHTVSDKIATYKLKNSKILAINTFEEQWKKEELMLLLTMLTPFSRNVVDNCYQASNEILFCTASQADLFRICYESLKKKYNDTKSPDKEKLEPIIAPLLENEGQRLHIYFDFKPIAVEKRLTGMDWAEQEELSAVIETLANKKSIFFVGDTLPAAFPLSQDQRFNDDTFKDFKKEFDKQESSLVGVFLMYICTGTYSADMSDLQLNQANSHGHWYSIVANKVGPQVQYLLADSLGNPSRVHNRRFIELMNYLHDGKTQPTVYTHQLSTNDVLTLSMNDISAMCSFSVQNDQSNENNKSSEFINKHPFLVGMVAGAVIVIIYKVLTYKKDEQKESKTGMLSDKDLFKKMFCMNDYEITVI